MGAAIDLAGLPPVMVVPGIAAWLGIADRAANEPDEYEQFLNRISQEDRNV